MTEVIKGNRHTEQTRDGDAYHFNFTMYVDGQEMPIQYRIDERHTADAFKKARGAILEHVENVGDVSHAWLTRIDGTSTDQYRETVFEYFRGRWTLY